MKCRVLTCRRLIPRSSSQICAECNRKRVSEYKEKIKQQLVAVAVTAQPLLALPATTVKTTTAVSTCDDKQDLVLNSLDKVLENMMDIEADKENRDTYNLPVNHPQQLFASERFRVCDRTTIF